MKKRRQLSSADVSGVLHDGSIWPVHRHCGIADEEWLAWNAEVQEAGRGAQAGWVAGPPRAVGAGVAGGRAAR